MVTASIAVIGLGFVVSVAASSRPGEEDEPWLDVSLRADVDLTQMFAWILLITAVVGAVLFALGLREAKPEERKSRRSILGLFVGIAVFVVILRWLRPLAESVLEATTEGSEAAADPGESTGGGSGWVFTVLIAAITAAALTRIGLSIRSGSAPLPDEAHQPIATTVEAPRAAAPRSRELGDDPRSRVLNAYGDFETASAHRGTARSETETEGRHARRVADEQALTSADIGQLSVRHADARYGDVPPSDTDASEAVDAVQRLIHEMDQ